MDVIEIVSSCNTVTNSALQTGPFYFVWDEYVCDLSLISTRMFRPEMFCVVYRERIKVSCIAQHAVTLSIE